MNKKADVYRGMESPGAEGGRGGIPLRSLKTFDSFRNPAYRIFYGAMAGQWISQSMQMVVRPLLAYRITLSGAILGSLSLAHAIPMLIISLFGGAIADRVQKKNILVVGQLGSAVVSLGIAFALTLGYLSPERPNSWWLLVASAMLQGVIMGFMMPSRSAIIYEIVGPERVMNAISLNNLGMNTFRLMGPALAGFVVDAIDFNAAYFIMTGMFVIGTTFAVFLPRTSVITVSRSSALTDILEGVRYIRHDKTIFIILVFSLLGIILGQPFMLLMPMITEDILKVGATGLGLLMMVSGLGAILGSLFLASISSRKRGVMFILTSVLFGLALVGFSFSHWWYPSLVLIAFVGLGQAGQHTLSITLTQTYVEANYRGRVISFLMMGIGMASLGTFIAGILAEAVGVQWSIGGFSIALALMSILVLLFSPLLRKLD
jgi:MFS family permease